jgi:hypothetical protein
MHLRQQEMAYLKRWVLRQEGEERLGSVGRSLGQLPHPHLATKRINVRRSIPKHYGVKQACAKRRRKNVGVEAQKSW